MVSRATVSLSGTREVVKVAGVQSVRQLTGLMAMRLPSLRRGMAQESSRTVL